MKKLTYIIVILISINADAQFSIAPQIGLSYSNFCVICFDGIIEERQQAKTFPSIGVRLNYQLKRVLFSGEYNIHKKNQFDIEITGPIFCPPVFYKVSNKEMGLSCSYNLIRNLFVGVGARLWVYNNIESLKGFRAERFEYTSTYASLMASYLINNVRLELSISRYLSVIGKSEDIAFNEILRAPEILSFKVGYNIQFNKKDNSK